MMRHTSQRARSQERGAAAIEFALVFPFLLATFLLTLTLGLALFGKYQAWNFASDAVRTCTTQTIPVNIDGLAGCVRDVVSDDMQRLQENGCANFSVGSTVQNPVSAENPGMGLLTVSVVCEQTNFLGGFSFLGFSSVGERPVYQLTSTSALPFLSYTN